MKQAVVGVGSPFGEDSVGWRVIDQLQPLLGGGAVELIKVDRPGVSLLEIMSDYQWVVLVDAVTDAAEDIVVLDQAALVDLSNGSLSSHAVGVAETIALGVALAQLPEHLCCIGVSLSRKEGKLERATKAVLAALK